MAGVQQADSAVVASTLPVPAQPRADLFPAPSVTYATPGLQPGRGSFTSNAELQALLSRLPVAQAVPAGTLHLLVEQLGTSRNGVPIAAVVVSRSVAHARPTPAGLENDVRPVVLIVAGQQGDAPASTEAALALLQGLAGHSEGGLPGQLLPLLEQAHLIVVPRANPDGFDLGVPGTADGVDLTQDHLLLRSPEAQALARFLTRWQPDVVVDAGEFPAVQPMLRHFGALLRSDIGTQYADPPGTHRLLAKAANEWLHQPLQDDLRKAGLVVDWVAQPVAAPVVAASVTASISPSATGAVPGAAPGAGPGLVMETSVPVTLANTAALRHAVGLTLRSRGSDLGYEHALRRTYSQVQSMLSVVTHAARRSSELRKLRAYVGKDLASQACKGMMTVQAQPVTRLKDVTLLHPDTYQPVQRRVAWTSAVQHEHPLQRVRPCGYWLAASAQPALERLRALGAQVQRVAEPAKVVVDGYFDTAMLAAKAALAAAAVPLAHRRLQDITVQRTLADAATHSYYLPVDQALAPGLLSAALELDMPWSYYRHGVLEHLGDTARVIAPPALIFADD